MAVTDQQKLDFLLKKIGYTKTKTGSVVGTGAISGTPKQPFAEAIPSPLIIANGALWNESDQIPTTPPGSDTTQVKVYLAASSGLRMTADSTSSGQRAYIAYSTYGNTSSTRLTNWIDTQFGSAYLIKVYKGDPNSGGVALSAAGSGANDGWFFDYSAGVLNFNDTSVPSGVTDTNIYIVGYRYIGSTGAPTPSGGGNFTFNDLVVSRNFSVGGLSTFTGLVDINGGGQANTFKVEDLTDNRVVIAGTGGELEDSANLTFNGSTLAVTGDATFSGNVAIGGTLTYEDVKNIDAVGLITARSGIRVTGGVIEAQAGENKIPSLYAAMGNLPSAASYHGMFAHVHATGRGYFAHASNWLELVNKELNGVVGTGTETYNIGNLVSTSSTATSLNVTGVTTTVTLDVNGDLDVDGHTNLDNVSISGVTTTSGLLDINAGGQANTFKVEDLTDNRIVIVGTGGELEDSANLTFDGSTLALTGSQTISGDIDVDGHTNLDNVSVAGVATVAGNIDANGDLDVEGQTNLDHVSISGVTTFTGALNIDSDIDVDGHTNLDNVSIAGVTTATGNIVANGSIDLAGDIDVDGHTNLDNVSVAGVTTFAANTRFNSTVSDYVGSAGTSGYYLKTTGSGVEWASFPSIRTRDTQTASSGQTSFTFNYNIGYIDVFVNGVKLTDSEFTATNGTSVVLAVGSFVGDIVELVSYNTVSASGGAHGIGNVVEDTTPQLGGNLDLFNKSITGTGNVNITGIISATSFKGPSGVTATFVGDGSGLTGVTASGSGVIVKNSGTTVGTAQTIDFGDNLSVSPASAGIVTITASASGGSGISTIGGVVNIVNDLDVDGHTNLDNVSISGVTTFAGQSIFNGNVILGNATSDTISVTARLGTNLVPISNDTKDLGTSSLRWRDLHVKNIVQSGGGTATFTNNIDANGDLDVDGHTNLDNVSVAGVTTFTGAISASDIRSNSLTLKNAAGGASYAVFSNGGSAELNWNNTKRLETTTSGVTVTGTVAATSYTGDGSALTGITAGISTINGTVNIANDLDVDGHTNLDNVNVAGVATFASTVNANAFSGNGASITAINASNIASGTIAAARVATLNQDTTGNAGTFTVTANNSTNETVYPVFVDGATGSQGAETDTGLNYNPSTGTLTSVKFIGDGSGLSGVTASGSGIVVQDEGSSVGTAGTVNFTEPITLSPVSSGITTVGINTSQWDVQQLNVSGIASVGQQLNVTGDLNFTSDNGTIRRNSKLLFSAGSGEPTYYAGTPAGAAGDHVFRTFAGGYSFERFRIGSDGDLGLNGTNYGTSGQVLTSQGSGSAATWTTISAGADVGITTNLSGSFTASAGTAATINTLTGYSANDLVVEYTIYIKNGSDFQSQKLLAMRDGTTIHSTQFAVMYSSSLLVQCDATISSGNILLRATPETGVSGSTTYKIKREVM